ncbi:MAG: imidazole glycerol phosphate synthase subunit HisH [Cellvibrio sp. 79]|nr:MAG: imidazole glycerol phosphate synthase subunit HisH [Cellvibrio sp. 79]
MISILDYGAGNTNSVVRMIEKVGGKSQRVSTPGEILNAEKLIIPGVGAYDHGMGQLHENGLIDALNIVALEKKIPILGICLGMQLMCNRSDEGSLPGLGWIDADVLRFSPDHLANLRVPHMGWNTLNISKENALLPLSETERRFYFVHSYRVTCNDASDVVASTHYGEDFVSAFQRNNLVGVQFHPEKSHRFGMSLFRNFLEANCA